MGTIQGWETRRRKAAEREEAIRAEEREKIRRRCLEESERRRIALIGAEEDRDEYLASAHGWEALRDFAAELEAP